MSALVGNNVVDERGINWEKESCRNLISLMKEGKRKGKRCSPSFGSLRDSLPVIKY